MKTEFYLCVKDKFHEKIQDAVHSTKGVSYGPVVISKRKDLSGESATYKRKTYRWQGKDFLWLDDLNDVFKYEIKVGELVNGRLVPCYYPELKIYDNADWIKLLKSKKKMFCTIIDEDLCQEIGCYFDIFPRKELLEHFEELKPSIPVAEVFDKIHKRDEAIIK